MCYEGKNSTSEQQKLIIIGAYSPPYIEVNLQNSYHLLNDLHKIISGAEYLVKNVFFVCILLYACTCIGILFIIKVRAFSIKLKFKHMTLIKNIIMADIK